MYGKYFNDDLGNGQYDYLGISERIPIHANKAREFQEKNDRFNAIHHALKCLSLCSTGYRFTPPFNQCLLVLNYFNWPFPVL